MKINNSIDGGLNWNTELSFNPMNNGNLYALKKITSTNSSIYCIGENGKVYKKNVPLAIENINTKNTITVYPNPTNKYVVVNPPTIAKYKIINLNGQIIQSGEVKNQKIITQYLKPNKYILQIIFDNKVETFKIIKQE